MASEEDIKILKQWGWDVKSLTEAKEVCLKHSKFISNDRLCYGLCNKIFGIVKHRPNSFPVTRAGPSWEHYSGWFGFPVPHPTAFSPLTPFAEGYCLWAEDEYGNLRRKFCLHVAKFIDELLEVWEDVAYEEY